MKKLLSFVIVAFALILVGCQESQITSNARAVVTAISKTTTEVSFRVELKDPNKELDSEEITVEVTSSNTELAKDTKVVDKITLFKFSNLERNTSYNISIKGFIEGKEVNLFSKDDAFATLASGEVIEDPILITTVEEFKAMNSKKHYKLANDLDFNNISFTPLFTAGSPFNGSFDGAGFTIKNINISAETDVNKSNLSIFGTAARATIKNLTLDNVKINNSAKPYTAISYIGLVVGKVTNNSFIMEDITILNSSIEILHNQGSTISPRNLYVGLLGGSLQGKIANATIKNSSIKVNQNILNGLFDNNDGSTTGTYVGGAIGMIEMDKGLSISKISVMDTTIDVTVDQLQKAKGSGLLYVGGVFGSYKSDKVVSELVSNATITVNHKKHNDTEAEHADILNVGGLFGGLLKASAKDLVYTGVVNITASNTLYNANVGLVAGLASLASERVVADAQLTLTTTTDSQTNVYADVYTKYGTWNKYNNVKILNASSLTIDGNLVDLSSYTKVQNISEVITSEFILSKLIA